MSSPDFSAGPRGARSDSAEALARALEPAAHIDSDHPAVAAFAAAVTADAASPVERAIALFYAVRDRIRYNPYVDYGREATYTASAVLAAGQGYCVGKAVLMCAAARAVGIPARLGLADVRNHLATPQLTELMQTDLFACHGYSELWLDERWIKVTPTFNIGLCERFDVRAIEFDGHGDALFHAYDSGGRLHMEYVNDRGSFDDVPFDELAGFMRDAYPRLWRETVVQAADEHDAARFDAEARAMHGQPTASARDQQR